MHQKLDGETGAILATFTPDYGGYGGLIDGNGILWSANLSGGYLARIDVNADPITDSYIDVGPSYSYGLGIDIDGNIYNTTFSGNSVVKLSPAGSILNSWPTLGDHYDRGVALTPDGHIWVANSGGSSGKNVSHLSPDGTVLKVIPVGVQPTGVAVDANGKIWVTNYQSDNVMRIDPNVDNGTVDKTVGLGVDAGPYNYSDMTGAVALGATTWTGSWSITQQGIDANTEWGTISWNAITPTGTQLKVEARSGGGPYQDITAYNDIPLCETGNSFTGLSLNVRVTFTGDPENNISPILEDLTIALCDDEPPVLDNDPLAVVTGECEATITEEPTATDYCDGLIDGETTDPLTYTEQGTFYVTWTFTDSKGNSVSQVQTVIIHDVTPPVLTLNSDVSVWPPNHSYTTFTVADMVSSVTDNCNTALTIGSVTINSVSSDEYENAVGNGDGNTVNDIVIALDCASVDVRNERSGTLNGRVYTVSLQVSDGNGNTTTEDFQIQVTHNMNGAPAIDDGLASGYAVMSACSGMQSKRIGHVSPGPEVCSLDQNYPNPFNPSTAIRYSISEDDHVILKVYDLYGREIATLVDAIMTAGTYEVQFDGSTLTSGTYVYVLTSNGSTIKRTMSLMK